MTTQQKAKLAYSVKETKYKRGHRLVKAGEVSDVLYIVQNGEFIIKHSRSAAEYISQDMIKIGARGIIGEEGIFFEEPFANDIICSMDANVFWYKRSELYSSLPDIVLYKIRDQYIEKKHTREKLVEKQRLNV